MRIANEEDEKATDAMRAAFKEGQRHRPDIARLIDDCDNWTVREITYAFAEQGRLKRCGDAPVAMSANCVDFRRNLSWSLFEAGICSSYAAYYISMGLPKGIPLRTRASFIRQGFKMAQGHRQEVFDSIDYIGDLLLVRLVEQFLSENSIDRVAERNYEKDQNAGYRCPGTAKFYKHWAYGEQP